MRSGPLAIFAAAALWGTAGTAGALTDAGSVPLAAARLVLGGAVLAALAARSLAAADPRHHGRGAGEPADQDGHLLGHAREAEKYRRGGPAPTPARSGIGAALASGLGLVRGRPALLLAAVAVAAYQLCFFAAVARTGVAIGTVVAIGSGPVFTGLLSWLLDRRPPTLRWALATTTAVAGCAVLVTGGEASGAEPGGIALALVGGLLYAFYAVMASRAIQTGLESGVVMGLLFGGAAVLMLPVLVVTAPGSLTEPRALLVAVYLGCATTALSYLLYGKGLRTTPVATAATLALAEPAVAALLGLAVLGERLSGPAWAGLGLLAVGLIIVALPERARTAPEPAAQRTASGA